MFVTISQSGRSDDLIEMAAMAKAAGACTVALVNDENSPLVQISHVVLPMAAGPELSVRSEVASRFPQITSTFIRHTSPGLLTRIYCLGLQS